MATLPHGECKNTCMLDDLGEFRKEGIFIALSPAVLHTHVNTHALLLTHKPIMQ
jgi:hypothetical protein